MRRGPTELLTALAGKDVVVAFVESYGKVAVQDPAFTDGVAKALEDGEAQLDRNGYSAQSAFLTSPTFGGVSWLAHSTLQSGVWVDSQTEVRPADRPRTGSPSPAPSTTPAGARSPSCRRTIEPWPEGTSFYGFDAVLDARSMGYRGPAFGYARMPDQYTWQVLHERELSEGREPVMAEIDLVSSHTPWTPLPALVPWAQVGDGAVFASQPAESESPVRGVDRPRACA